MELTVEQKIRDSAIREKGIQLSSEEVQTLFRRHDSISERAAADDGLVAAEKEPQTSSRVPAEEEEG